MPKITKDLIADLGIEELIVLEPDFFMDALIGITSDNRAVYSYDRLVDVYLKNNPGTTENEAVEYIDYNIINVYVGDKQPIIMDTEFYDYKD